MDKYNHNKLDKNKLNEFIIKQHQLSIQREEDNRRRILKSNMETWQREVGPKFAKSNPNKLRKEIIKSIKQNDVLKPNHSMILCHKNIQESQYLAYSLVNMYIAQGYITPNEIRRTSLYDASQNIHGMYQARAWKDYFFHQDAKLLIIDNGSLSGQLLGDNINKFWFELFEFVKSNDRIFIFIYQLSDQEKFPSLTSNDNYNKLILKSTKFILKGENCRETTMKERVE